MLGYFAGLATASTDLEGSNRELKVGLIAGQEYPEMMQKIKPGFEQGLKEAAPGGELDFRVIGNWYDAAKASDLAKSMFASGVDIILTIAGGANQGVVSAAKEEGRYVLWYDTAGYAIEPGVIIGSGIIREDRAAYEQTMAALKGELTRGSSRYAGVKEGYVDFLDNDPLYEEHVPEALRKMMAAELEKLRSGSLMLR
jgi:basic membrane lipoprotein Med (substrate-binding protein (PBP1-ABC) superfamily)